MATNLNTYTEVRVVPNTDNTAICFFKGLRQPFIILSEAIEEYMERFRAACWEQVEELGGAELFRFLLMSHWSRFACRRYNIPLKTHFCLDELPCLVVEHACRNEAVHDDPHIQVRRDLQ